MRTFVSTAVITSRPDPIGTVLASPRTMRFVSQPSWELPDAVHGCDRVLGRSGLGDHDAALDLLEFDLLARSKTHSVAQGLGDDHLAALPDRRLHTVMV